MSTDQFADRPDEISMTLPAIEVRHRMAQQWAAKQPNVPWVATQHFHHDVPALIAQLERFRDDADRREEEAWHRGWAAAQASDEVRASTEAGR